MKTRLFILACSAAFSSCTSTPYSSPETIVSDWSQLSASTQQTALRGTVSFTAHVKPVLKAKCVYCHQGAAPAGGFDMRSRAAVFGTGAYGPRVKPGDPDGSVLVANISKTHDKVRSMPPVGNAVTAEEKLILRRWIEQGAVWPASVTLTP